MNVDRGVLETIAEIGVLPVVTVDREDDIDPLADALAGGGLTAIEVTLRTGDGLAAIARSASRSDVMVGAGTVLDATQVDAAVDAGARFVVSPGLHAEVVRRARERGVLAVPGVATPTELMTAARLGLDVVKFFPAVAAGGVGAVRAMAAVMPDMRFMPTGGISASSAPDYLALDAVVAVGGSWMAPEDAVAAGDWGTIRALALECRRIVNEAR